LQLGIAAAPQGVATAGLDQGGTTGREDNASEPRQSTDDDVSTVLDAQHPFGTPPILNRRLVRLRTTYNGATPDPAYIPGWRLLSMGFPPAWPFLSTSKLFSHATGIHDQITRLVLCGGLERNRMVVGLRFDDLLACYPPVSQAKWAHLGIVRQSRRKRESGSIFRFD